MIIRGFRNLSQKYAGNSTFVPDTPEIIRNDTVLNFEGINCCAKLINEIPEQISLRVSINAIPFQDTVKLIRQEKTKSYEIKNIYDPSCFYRNYEIKQRFYQSITINYENSGYFVQDSSKQEFLDNNFEQYKILVNNEIYRIDFQRISDAEIIERADSPNIVYTYPYGGFYEMNCHSKQIQQYIFRTIFEGNSLKIKAYVSDLPHNSLYDKIKMGDCKFNLKSDSGEFTYSSCNITHVDHTNLAIITFKPQ